MVCNTNQFLSFPFCGPHTKKHGVRGLSKHYCMMFDPKLGHGVCSIGRIPCVCNEYTYMLDKPQVHSLPSQQQLRYQPVTSCTYWPVLGSFNRWNIIILSQKATTSEDFENIYQVVLDSISDNIASFVQYGKYGAMNTVDTSIMGYYVVKFF